jgi:hypothetical protein
MLIVTFIIHLGQATSVRVPIDEHSHECVLFFAYTKMLGAQEVNVFASFVAMVVADTLQLGKRRRIRLSQPNIETEDIGLDQHNNAEGHTSSRERHDIQLQRPRQAVMIVSERISSSMETHMLSLTMLKEVVKGDAEWEYKMVKNENSSANNSHQLDSKSAYSLVPSPFGSHGWSVWVGWMQRRLADGAPARDCASLGSVSRNLSG